MELKPIKVDVTTYPDELHPILSGTSLYDSSCSPEARVIFIDKDSGYFLKSAPKGKLDREATMMRYFYSKGLSSSVLAYISDAEDWLLTEKIYGDDCIAAKYLENPKQLCDSIAERLVQLHSLDFSDCPIQDHTERFLESAKVNYGNGLFDKQIATDWGFGNAEEAWMVVENSHRSLKTDTLLHGDYCLPNIILNDWNFSGFIDLDNAGVGDKHVDVFWATWTLFFNLHTHAYRERFIDAYGRSKIDEEVLRIVAAVEVFG